MIDFVGAGPGAEDLITVRGMELIKKADVIVYAGSLVNPKLLEYAKEDVKIYNSAYMTLEEVMDVMIKAHEEEKRVVRLHTGEPSLYGAIREQMDILDEKDIIYSVCPGVSACFAAAASLGIEYTLPSVSQTLIITRLEGKTPVPEKESMEALASHGASMAVYLSTGMLNTLSKKLIDGGYDPDTPAALVYKASWPGEEKSLLCTVATLDETAKKNNIKKTAVVLVGEATNPKVYDRSKLYDPSFSTEYRKAKE